MGRSNSSYEAACIIKFPMRLNTLLAENDVSQVALAKVIGRERKCVSNWIHGVGIPNAAMIVRLSRLFGVSSDWLLGLSDER